MRAPELYTRFLRPLNVTGIPYMITGGLAAIVYGEPRLTNHVDVVIALEPDMAHRLAEVFPPPDYDAPPVEVLREEASRDAWGHFNILHVETALRADMYPVGTDPLGAWAMSRRQPIPIADDTIWVAPIEYVILKKLAYYRDGRSDRHLRDIGSMVRLSGDQVDRPVLDAWLERLGLQREWGLVSSYIR